MSYQMMSFYQFMPLQAPAAYQARFKELGLSLSLKGSLILSPEGLNASLCGKACNLAHFCEVLKAELPEFAPTVNYAKIDTPAFARFKVLLKAEIVTLKWQASDDIAAQLIDPEAWHALMDQSDICLIDTRNDYEVALGSFQNALNPKTQSFSQFKDFVQENLNPELQPKLALFCTGGIRCEKVAPFLKAQGFKEIYQLKGGILNYLAQTPAEHSRFTGECFVFDERHKV